MVFNSLAFFIFFAAVLALYHLPWSWTARKRMLLAASYLFYASWNPPFVLLLALSTGVDWTAAGRIARGAGPKARRAWLLLSLGVNLGLLGFFKYGDFLLDNFLWLAARAGVHFSPIDLGLFLPVGISFYTFQTLSYTLDVYLGRGRPAVSLLDYALYVSFFPQLVAGPIVRAPVLLEQFAAPRRADGPGFAWGLSLLTVGLFQKMVLADSLLSGVSEAVFAPGAAVGHADAWLGALAFGGQIFCDFAGYSTCAIGVALCLGFRLPINFAFPYAALGFQDFWRRWHISLSTWLRDYLYIPLGGNRRGRARTGLNIMVTMLLGGLWHGAAWTFVLWGGLHGLYLLAERGARRLWGGGSFWSRALPRLGLGLLTFALVDLAWVLFRSAGLDQALGLLGAMLGLGASPGAGLVSRFDAAVVLAVVGGILLTHWLMRERTLEQVAARTPWWLRGLVLAGMLFCIVVLGEVNRAFIYFQF